MQPLFPVRIIDVIDQRDIYKIGGREREGRRWEKMVEDSKKREEKEKTRITGG